MSEKKEEKKEVKPAEPAAKKETEKEAHAPEHHAHVPAIKTVKKDKSGPLLSIFGRKVGMTQIFDEKGDVVPVTVIHAAPSVILKKQTKEKDGYTSIQIGFEESKKVNKPETGHQKKAGVEKAYKIIKEIRVDDLSKFSVGQQINVDIFSPGEIVDVSGTSIGKGFQGTIKRWHFTRGPMSHGSKFHRHPGSIGAGTTPGRVVKGLRMAGHMGNRQVTVKNLLVVSVDAEKNLLLLMGAVPGKKNSLVFIRSKR